MKGGIAMPKCVLKIVNHKGAGFTLFASIVDFFVNGEPVCHETRFIRNDSMATIVYNKSIAMGVLNLANGESFEVWDWEEVYA